MYVDIDIGTRCQFCNQVIKNGSYYIKSRSDEGYSNKQDLEADNLSIDLIY